MRGAGDRLKPVPAPLRNPARAEIGSRMSQGVNYRRSSHFLSVALSLPRCALAHSVLGFKLIDHDLGRKPYLFICLRLKGFLYTSLLICISFLFSTARSLQDLQGLYPPQEVLLPLTACPPSLAPCAGFPPSRQSSRSCSNSNRRSSGLCAGSRASAGTPSARRSEQRVRDGPGTAHRDGPGRRGAKVRRAPGMQAAPCPGPVQGHGAGAHGSPVDRCNGFLAQELRRRWRRGRREQRVAVQAVTWRAWQAGAQRGNGGWQVLRERGRRRGARRGWSRRELYCSEPEEQISAVVAPELQLPPSTGLQHEPAVGRRCD